MPDSAVLSGILLFDQYLPPFLMPQNFWLAVFWNLTKGIGL